MSSVLIDFDEDYYGILGLDRLDFTPGMTLAEKQANVKLVHKAYTRLAAQWHPDVKWKGPGPEPTTQEKSDMFKKIVKAHSVLSNDRIRRVYDKGEMEDIDGVNVEIKIDWEKLGKYKKNSAEDYLGNLLYHAIIQKIGSDNIYSASAPHDESIDNYVWEIKIKKDAEPLSISIVSDPNEVLRLTNGQSIEDAVGFKIYIFFPGEKVRIVRDVEHNIKNCTAIDYVLYEGASQKEALDAIDKFVVSFVKKYLSGELQQLVTA